MEFSDVRVPVANRIGEQDKGWTYAKALLAHERTAIAGVADSKRPVADRGHRVLLVSTDPASNLDEVLGVKLGNDPTPIESVPWSFSTAVAV